MNEQNKDKFVSAAEEAMRRLRKEGCGRESLKKIVDKVCNEVPLES